MAAAKDLPGGATLDHARVGLTVDVVALTVADNQLQVALVARDDDALPGRCALPGVAVQPEEPLDLAAGRALGALARPGGPAYLEQLGAYSAPASGSGHRVVTVGYLAVTPEAPGAPGVAAGLFPVSDVLAGRPRRRISLDQRRILADGVARAQAQLESTSLAMSFLGTEFTLSQLRAVYEAAWGQPLDPGNFRRKVLATPGMVVATGRATRPGPGGGKPADTYTAGTGRMDPPMSRPRGQ